MSDNGQWVLSMKREIEGVAQGKSNTGLVWVDRASGFSSIQNIIWSKYPTKRAMVCNVNQTERLSPN